MIIHRPKQIFLKPGKRLHVVPIGDVQSESQQYRLRGVVDWAVEEERAGNFVRFFGTGDYYETTSPSERVKLDGANLHDSTYETLNREAIAQADRFIEILKPVKGKIWTILQGHHTATLMFGKNMISSDDYIATKLGADYAGDGTLVIDCLVNGLPFRIFTMHGYGSARTGGAKINKRYRMRETILNANWYAMGHDNSKLSDATEPLEIKDGEIRPLKQYFTGIGSFQEAYELGKFAASYAEKFNLSPSVLGVMRMTIEMDYGEKQPRLDYHLRS